jgi:hypothetical protein
VDSVRELGGSLGAHLRCLAGQGADHPGTFHGYFDICLGEVLDDLVMDGLGEIQSDPLLRSGGGHLSHSNVEGPTHRSEQDVDMCCL